jgi:hypothetical protein
MAGETTAPVAMVHAFKEVPSSKQSPSKRARLPQNSWAAPSRQRAETLPSRARMMPADVVCETPLKVARRTVVAVVAGTQGAWMGGTVPGSRRRWCPLFHPADAERAEEGREIGRLSGGGDTAISDGEPDRCRDIDGFAGRGHQRDGWSPELAQVRAMHGDMRCDPVPFGHRFVDIDVPTRKGPAPGRPEQPV